MKSSIVCADRYAYTAFARDVVRGMDRHWVRELYSFAVKPTAAFYFRVPLAVAINRILDGRNGVKYYEAGMDLGLSEDPEESFGIFQGRILDEYEKMVPEFDLTTVDATLPIEEQQAYMRQIVKAKLAQAMKDGIPRPLTTKDLLTAAAAVKPSTRDWFASAKNHALYANQGGTYDEVLKYLDRT